MTLAAEPAAGIAKRTFRVVLIKPSHYDDDGYVIQWWKAWIPSNSLASLYALARDLGEKRALGDDVEMVIEAYDEMNTVLPIARIADRLLAEGNVGLVCLTGVQSNQFPRAMDLARQFRERGVQVAVGGFHVSGCLSMLPEPPADLKEAMALGVSIFAGEAEHRLDEVFADALKGELKPVYNYLSDLPALQQAITPFLPAELVQKYDGVISSFDAGRGCPFQCSFCTIINVQGRKSRWRDADDIERLVRQNREQGIWRFFITDDNFARNKNWEAIFDRLIELKERDGLEVRFLIQVDTLCHKSPGFVEKAARAGCTHVFIGLENINPDNLVAMKKNQNRITEYRRMFQMWKEAGVITYAGYILGLPGDTPETIKRDIEIVQREIPVDLLEFTILTPLPGSEDHQRLTREGIWMDPDMNKYDLEHVTTEHPKMSREVWQQTYREVWRWYYTDEHVARMMRRNVRYGIKPVRIWHGVLQIYCAMRYEGVHPQQCGYFRYKLRSQRRPSLPRESILAFYPKRAWEILATYGGMGLYLWRIHRIRKRIQKDPASRSYTDLAITHVEDAEGEDLEMFELNDASRAAVEKAKRQAAGRKGNAPAEAEVPVEAAE
ncbi:Radical SAM superfamily enzyme YgiQ, UPF0313 family [Tistlia consotensis]|uniref:Radical SAM superfamily enzyme YgiQ, UPF0313 family n=1 Tax=Tistlia consotensis USBA 355 TaxID=560819 RepID=A0A1Y6B952_9PROT|nr:radical SAM protein [Tistlia consotensis]SME97976.1 Radical SAM superfamily enzyme YgiQ, UPF0313 family [Tistlia consotensis USBA 355]SNR57364.1 Radical SAM superfamily enzyme YgiQ, UPF0313 family [Tistlia consotensis]